MANILTPCPVLTSDFVKGEVSVDVAESEAVNRIAEDAGSSPGPPTVYTMSELADDRHLLHEIVSVINAAYLPVDVNFSSGLRFPEDQDLVDQFGPTALCSVIRSGKKVIATASVHKWREAEGSVVDETFRKSRPDDYPLVEDGRSYEVKGVATVLDPAYRKKGLAGQCIAALEGALFKRHEGGDILLWLHAAEKQNGPYWRRRGFEEVLIETKHPPFWGSFEPFQFTTMVKRVSQGPKVE